MVIDVRIVFVGGGVRGLRREFKGVVWSVGNKFLFWFKWCLYRCMYMYKIINLCI